MSFHKHKRGVRRKSMKPGLPPCVAAFGAMLPRGRMVVAGRERGGDFQLRFRNGMRVTIVRLTEAAGGALWHAMDKLL
jgi:hypothetical protein